MAITELEPEAIMRDGTEEGFFGDSNDDGEGLTREEKNEQSRRDAELSMMLLAEELLEQGVPQEEIASYALQTQLLAMSSQSILTSPSLLKSPEISPSRGHEEDRLDLNCIAQLTVEGVATRPLPPAYGPLYSPEPSTSQAGSPIHVLRRLSISSTVSSVSTSSAPSTVASSSYTLEDEEELMEKVQQVLDERYEATRATILADLEKQAEKTQKPEHVHRTHPWANGRLGTINRRTDDVEALAHAIEEKRVGGKDHGETFPIPFPSPPPLLDRYCSRPFGRGPRRSHGGCDVGHLPVSFRDNNSLNTEDSINFQSLILPQGFESKGVSSGARHQERPLTAPYLLF